MGMSNDFINGRMESWKNGKPTLIPCLAGRQAIFQHSKWKHNLFFNLILLCLLISVGKTYAQDEVLTDLQINTVVADAWLQYKYSPMAKMLASGATYNTLPFMDDFSKASPYPNPNNWIDKKVFINRTYCKAPVSIGVATFDGIDSTGYPYNFSASASSSGIGDYLTSLPIRLDSSGNQKLTPADSVYLSFYYQAAGRGDAPEPRDSLVLEFQSPATIGWYHVWTQTGYNPTPGDSNFYRVMIPVTDSFYFKKDFQFRFKSYATLSGNVDHWHVDYVYLNKGRSMNDTLLKDVTFAYGAGSFMKVFRAMPYEQYNGDFQDSIKLFLRNNFNSSLTTSFHYEIDSSTVIKHTSPTSSASIAPYTSSGYNNLLAKSKPLFDYAIPQKISVITSDSSSYLCKYYINTPGDINTSNDTVMFRQNFTNYFAYDDGSTEAGYGLSTQYAKLAYKFYLSRPDTFRGAEIFFNPVINNASGWGFRLVLWNDNGGIPGTILYKDSVVNPIYEKGEYNKFHTYKFTSGTFVTPGTYYIGWIQNTNNVMNIGFDKNINTQSKIFYDVGSGWNNTINKGSLMLRPLLGKSLVLTSVGEKKSNAQTFDIYPNPANEIINLKMSGFEDLKMVNIEIYNLFGEKIYYYDHLQISTSSNFQINMSSKPDGIYFVRVSDKETFSIKRLVIAR